MERDDREEVVRILRLHPLHKKLFHPIVHLRINEMNGVQEKKSNNLRNVVVPSNIGRAAPTIVLEL